MKEETHGKRSTDTDTEELSLGPIDLNSSSSENVSYLSINHRVPPSYPAVTVGVLLPAAGVLSEFGPPRRLMARFV